MLLKITNFDDSVADEVKKLTGAATASKAAHSVLNSYKDDCENYDSLDRRYNKLQDKYDSLKKEMKDLKTALRYVRDAIE